jgi:hypothetical protein
MLGVLDERPLLPQRFLELLAGTQARVDHGNLADGQSRQPDQIFDQLDDPQRLTHLEHEQLAAAADPGGLQHQVHGFGNRHEEALHLGMRDLHGPAGFDLLLERRDRAAAAASTLPKRTTT